MVSAGFEQAEAEALVGKTFMTVFAVTNLPKGVRGCVIGTDHNDGAWEVVIQWEAARGGPRRGLYTKLEVMSYLREVEA